MIMKKLQNDFTTPEQSKRLLGLGVPADSADCYYDVLYDNDGYFWRNENHPTIVINDYEYDTDGNEFILPCWSVGRMMEIAHICSDSTLSYKEEENEIQKFKEEHKCKTLIEAVIMCIADAVSIGGMNFSKLEE